MENRVFYKFSLLGFTGLFLTITRNTLHLFIVIIDISTVLEFSIRKEYSDIHLQ